MTESSSLAAGLTANREPRNLVDPLRPYAMLVERERNRVGEIEAVGTVFLTNRDCPFHCTMCDLWQNTLRDTVAVGNIPRQIEVAIESLPPFDSIKLYNSGNFFDPQAIPIADYARIASLVSRFKTVIVENHPRLCGQRCIEFAQMIFPAQLEIALGLETSHEPSLLWLNKAMMLGHFKDAAVELKSHGIAMRVFLLLGLPRMTTSESCQWLLKSIEFAASCGCDSFSIIPTRATMEPLQLLTQAGQFQRPSASEIESTFEAALQLGLGRVFLDLWDAESWLGCEHCRNNKFRRLTAMNLTQFVSPRIECSFCDRTVHQ